MKRLTSLKFVVASALALGALGAASVAEARTDVYFSLGVPGVYVQPEPVYVQPQPVYVQPPVYGQPPIHVQPPPQVQPSPRWEGRGGERAERRWNPRAPRLRPGDALPPEYRQRQFVVNDWRAHRLYAPPPGHQWVQPEPGNYILIGRNGEIVNMLVGQ